MTKSSSESNDRPRPALRLHVWRAGSRNAADPDPSADGQAAARPPAEPPSENPPSSPRHATIRALEMIERSASSLRVVPVLAIVAALWWGREVFIPIVLSILVSYALEPIVAALESRHVHRAIGAPIVVLAVLAALGFGAYALRGEAVAFVNRLPDAARRVSELLQRTDGGTPRTVAKVQEAARELEAATQNKPPKGVTPVRVEETTFKWSDWLWQGSNGVVKFAGQMFVVLCLVFYMLVAGDMYKRKFVHIAPTLSNKKLTVQILADIDRQIERFLMARLLISAIIGIAVWISFRVIGLEEPGLWGVLSAVLFAIPIVGPTVIVVCAFIAGFLQFGSAMMGGAASGACIVIGLFEGNILTPLLMSRAGEMNAVAVFVSLIFWGWLWGVWGLLLAVPITAALKAVCDRVEEYNAFAELLRE